MPCTVRAKVYDSKQRSLGFSLITLNSLSNEHGERSRPALLPSPPERAVLRFKKATRAVAFRSSAAWPCPRKNKGEASSRQERVPGPRTASQPPVSHSAHLSVRWGKTPAPAPSQWPMAPAMPPDPMLRLGNHRVMANAAPGSEIGE